MLGEGFAMSSEDDDWDEEPESDHEEMGTPAEWSFEPSPQLVEERVSRVTALLNKAGFAQRSREELLEELKERHYNEHEVVEGYLERREVEKHKERGNALFAEGKHEEAVDAYTAGINSLRGFGAFDRRLTAVLRANASACCLTMGDAGSASGHAQMATQVDPSYEKGWLRLGAAYDALGHRGAALEAYGKVRSNAVAAKRVAELNAPPVVISEDGPSGVPQGSLYLDVADEFHKPFTFLGRARFPSEPLLEGEARIAEHNYALRNYVVLLADLDEGNCFGEEALGRRHVLAQENVPQDRLWFDVMSRFVSLYNVVEDGCSRQLSKNAWKIPVVLVAVWTGEGEPPVDKTPTEAPCPWKDLKRVRAMLLRNATVLSDSTRQSNPVPAGFVLSVLTHVAAPELDYSILEGCSAPDCKVERASYRCGRCYLARYCGEEHMAAHWREHKKLCVPLEQRGPTITLNCARSYLDRRMIAKPLGFDRMQVPKKTFSGVVVVKVRMRSPLFFTICDPNGVFVLRDCDEWNYGPCNSEESFLLLKKLMLQRGTVAAKDEYGCDAYGYFDADMSVKGRLIIYFDRNWSCTW
jgi:tetratricopeptide (TPR) repeat protein